MSEAQENFTLHLEYKYFTPGKSSLKFETLMPYGYTVSETNLSYIMLMLLFVGSLSIFGLTRIYEESIVPFLFQHFSEVTTAHVTQCEMRYTKQYGYVPNLTYIYSWNNQKITHSEVIYGYGLSDCKQYLNQPISIRVLFIDSSQMHTVLADTSHSIIEPILTTVALMVAVAGGLFVVFVGMRSIVVFLRTTVYYFRLTEKGTLLQGKIVGIRAYTPPKSSEYIVVVDYEFEAPRKKYLTGHVQARRDDLRDVSLPPVGMPVAILYADNHAHMML